MHRFAVAALARKRAATQRRRLVMLLAALGAILVAAVFLNGA
jgi:hypothetical protein